MFTYMPGLYGPRTLQHVSFQRTVNQNRDVSRPMRIYIFYVFRVIQQNLKFMKGNIKSLCILYRPVFIFKELDNRASQQK